MQFGKCSSPNKLKIKVIAVCICCNENSSKNSSIIFICQDEDQIYFLKWQEEILTLNTECAHTILSIVVGPCFKNYPSF